MKVIFLDFDGVVNSWPHLEAMEKGGEPPADDLEREYYALVPGGEDPDFWLWKYRMFSREKVGLVGQIIARTGAKVVVSSSWRRAYDLHELQAFLRCHGLKDSDVIDITPTDLHLNKELGYIPRGLEIRTWLDAHPEVTAFVVLDDESDMDGVEEQFVQTNMDVGITQENVDQAVAILNLV
jgi:hypothetical protein